MRLNSCMLRSSLLPAFAILWSLPALGEIQSFTASVQTSVLQFHNGANGPTASQSLSFPVPQATLPLQSLSSLTSSVGGGPSAASVAGQFADPNSSPLVNPEEFAINLSLNSVSTTESFRGMAVSTEARTVNFAPGELDALSVEGSPADLVGRLYIDGALAILAADSNRNLDGAAVILTVTVVQSTAGQADVTVFNGELDLRGASDGSVNVTAFNDFPTRALLLNDLSVVSTQFHTFRTLIIPNVQISYNYHAVVGTPTTLTATVQIEAQNVPNNSGIAAVLGTPTDALGDVIGLTNGKAAADETLKLIADARQNQTGTPAFPQAQPNPSLCGAFGLEMALGLCGLGFLKLHGASRRRTKVN